MDDGPHCVRIPGGKMPGKRILKSIGSFALQKGYESTKTPKQIVLWRQGTYTHINSLHQALDARTHVHPTKMSTQSKITLTHSQEEEMKKGSYITSHVPVYSLATVLPLPPPSLFIPESCSCCFLRLSQQ